MRAYRPLRGEARRASAHDLKPPAVAGRLQWAGLLAAAKDTSVSAAADSASIATFRLPGGRYSAGYGHLDGSGDDACVPCQRPLKSRGLSGHDKRHH